MHHELNMSAVDVFKKNNANAINSVIRNMLCQRGCVDFKDFNGCEFDLDYITIQKSFDQSINANANTITKLDVYRQLVLIDSLYSTNVKRMRQFGLEEICDDIWNLCNDGCGNYSLQTLAKQLTVTNNLPAHISQLFTQPYGYIEGKKSLSAPSLLSKYFFFAAARCSQGGWGFPIYD